MSVSLRLRCIKLRGRCQTQGKPGYRACNNSCVAPASVAPHGTMMASAARSRGRKLKRYELKLKRCEPAPAETRDGQHYIGGSFLAVPGGQAPVAALAIGTQGVRVRD